MSYINLHQLYENVMEQCHETEIFNGVRQLNEQKVDFEFWIGLCLITIFSIYLYSDSLLRTLN